MAWYPGATKRELPQSKTQDKITPRSIVLHTAVSNSSDLYSFFNGRSNGVESHFYVTETGKVLQYIDTAVRADCQLDGNKYGISIETWDGAGKVWDGKNVSALPEWNAAQRTALVNLMAWICKTHNIPAQTCTAWDGRGIGWHAQFTGPRPSWNTSHACPGPRRIAQVSGLITGVKNALNGDGGNNMSDPNVDLGADIQKRYNYGQRVYRESQLVADGSWHSRHACQQLARLESKANKIINLLEGK